MPMTDSEFDYNFRVATGLNTITAEWVRSIVPDSFNGKVYWFIKIAGKISLLYTIYSDDAKPVKYGRFDTINGEEDYEYAGFKYIGKASELIKKLLHLIFGEVMGSSMTYMLGDAGESIILNSGEKIIV